MPFSVRLSDARKARNLSQTRLAKLANVSNAAISLLEKGDRDPMLSVAVKLARALDVSVDYLAGTDIDVRADEFAVADKLRRIQDILSE